MKYFGFTDKCLAVRSHINKICHVNNDCDQCPFDQPCSDSFGLCYGYFFGVDGSLDSLKSFLRVGRFNCDDCLAEKHNLSICQDIKELITYYQQHPDLCMQDIDKYMFLQKLEKNND